MKLGIVGLPNVGKSTLFNSLTKAGAESANYPFCTIDPNVGVVAVPDERLGLLADMYHSAKVTPAVIEFVDIAGLVKGASKGEGLGNQFLANIREVDAIVHVVRCFEDPNVIHVDGSIDPLRDIETINLELIFSDLEILERRISKTVRGARNDKALAKELDLLERVKAWLEDGKMAISFTTDDEDEQEWLSGYNLLTRKPVIFAANVATAADMRAVAVASGSMEPEIPRGSLCIVVGGEKTDVGDVVLYEEGLDERTMMNAIQAIAQADLLIVGGTSLVVYPAAGLIRYFQGKHLVLINKDKTSMDHIADLVIHDSIGKVLSESVELYD